MFTVDKATADEDKIMEVALEAGAEDVKDEGEVWEIHCGPAEFNTVSQALADAGIKPSDSEYTKLPSTTVAVTDVGEAGRVLKLMEALDEYDDVQQVYANFDIDDEVMASLED